MAVEIDIEKHFRDFHLRVCLKNQSSTMGILGASGSGKSMTLRCIAGIEKPDRGKIVINGKTVFDSEKGIHLKPQERRIGYLFQNYALFPTMTVAENIGCGFQGKKKEKAERTEAFLRRYHLEGLENHYTSQLSGGQQQRVALARMMIGEPEMILLDEPFSALDGYLKDVLQRDMQEFLKEYEGDLLLVTHNRDEVFKFCEELTLLKEGTVLMTGKTREVFSQPRLVEAARLTGCKNYSRILKLDTYHLKALDWGIVLRTEVEIPEDVTYVAIRGHWLRPSGGEKENVMPVEMVERLENTFEYQYRMKNTRMSEGTPVWWMCQKKSFTEDDSVELPAELYFPPEHLMLLK